MIFLLLIEARVIAMFIFIGVFTMEILIAVSVLLGLAFVLNLISFLIQCTKLSTASFFEVPANYESKQSMTEQEIIRT